MKVHWDDDGEMHILADDDDYDVPVEALSGAHPVDVSSHDTSALVLQLVTAVYQLSMLLEEAEPEEIRPVLGRIKRLQKLVRELPLAGQPRKPMGFRASPKRKKR